jgi:hypothetical protein
MGLGYGRLKFHQKLLKSSVFPGIPCWLPYWLENKERIKGR